jgi:CRP-like cAMP-binding protein
VVCELPLEALADLRAAGTAAVYRKHQVVFAEGQPAPGLYVVCSGAVKLYHSDRFGREHVVDVVLPGAVIGEVSLDHAGRASVSAETVAESQLLVVPNDALPALLQRHPEAGMRMLVALSQALGRTQRKLRDLALKGAESRLAGLLVELGGGEEGKPLPPYKRRELADMVGVSTETAIRLLAKLKTKGVVGSEGREIVIRDCERLRRIASHDEA